jgi:hypothetical protein
MELWTMFQKAAELYGLPFALFIASQVYFIWDGRQRETRYIEREERYIGVIQTLSEDVKDRLTKIETKLDI